MLILKFDPYPLLETGRLLLRQLRMDDAADIFSLRTNVDAMKYIGKPPATSVEDAKGLIKKMEDGYMQNEGIAWGITLKNQPEVIGTIGFHRIEKDHSRAEIGYMLAPAQWKKGIMSEAIQKIIDFGFKEMKLHSIEAKIDPKNIASAAILEKHHFIREGYFKENYFFNGKFLDTAIYSLLNRTGSIQS